MTPNNNITSSIEVVIPHQSIEETKQVREAVTQHCLANHPAFQSLNKPHPNGRMYKGLDKNGAVVGAAISPFYHEFKNQVDPEIAHIIMALNLYHKSMVFLH